MGLSNVMRERRRALGLSQKDLSERSGVTARQIARYEAGEQQPALNVAAAIAAALDISVADLAEESPDRPDLSGTWSLTWAAVDGAVGAPLIDAVTLIQTGTTVRLVADAPAAGRRAWRAELRLAAGNTLVGWYLSDDDEGTDSGTLLAVVDPDTRRGHGRWVAVGADGAVQTGRVHLNGSVGGPSN